MPFMKRNSVTFDSITKRFTQLDDPPPKKAPKVELTEEDERRVIESFKEIMKREPTEEEKETLFVEERKIKRGRN